MWRRARPTGCQGYTGGRDSCIHSCLSRRSCLHMTWLISACHLYTVTKGANSDRIAILDHTAKTKVIMMRTRHGNLYNTAPPAQPDVTGLDSNNVPKEWLTNDDNRTPMALFVVGECPVEVSSFRHGHLRIHNQATIYYRNSKRS